MKTALFIPGLGKDPTINKQKRVINWWNSNRLAAQLFEPKWHDVESLDDKYKRLLKQFDELDSDEVYVSAASAGGSLATRLLADRSDKIAEMKIVCGKIRGSAGVGPSYQESSPQLKPSVEASEAAIEKLTPDQTQKLTTYRPIIELVVPLRDMQVNGARNKRLLTAGHVFTIAFSLLFVLRP